MKTNKMMKITLIAIVASFASAGAAQAASPELYAREDLTILDTNNLSQMQSALDAVNNKINILNGTISFNPGVSARAYFEPALVVDANAMGSLIEAQVTGGVHFGAQHPVSFAYDATATAFAEVAYSKSEPNAPFAAQVYFQYPSVSFPNGVPTVTETMMPLVPYTQVSSYVVPITLKDARDVALPFPSLPPVTVGPVTFTLSWNGKLHAAYDIGLFPNGEGHANFTLGAVGTLTLAASSGSNGVSVNGSITFDALGDGTSAQANAQIDAAASNADGSPTWCADGWVSFSTSKLASVSNSLGIDAVSASGFSTNNVIPLLPPTVSCMSTTTGGKMSYGDVTILGYGSNGQPPPPAAPPPPPPPPTPVYHGGKNGCQGTCQ